MAKFEIGNDLVPPISIDRILLEPGVEDGKVNVFLDMSIQDSLDNKNTSWLFQEDFIDYLSVKIIQSHSNEDTEMILTEDMSTILVSINNNNFEGDNKDIKVSNIVKDFQNKIDGNENVIKDMSFAGTPIETSDGRLVYRIPIKYNFETTLTDHFSIFAYVHIDMEKIYTDSGLSIPPDAFAEKVHGEMSGETVIDRGAIVSTSTVFYTTDSSGRQTIWMGPVKYDKSNDLYYAPGTNPTKILEKTSIPNYKVQDLRSTRISVNPPVIREAEEQFKRAQKRLTNNDTLNFGINTDNYSSPGRISRGSEGIISFSFDLSFYNLVKYKSLFGSLVSGPSEEEILNKSRITEIKVMRRRVKKKNTNSKLDTSISDICIFDKNEPWEMIAISGEQENKRFVDQATYYGNIPDKSKVDQNIIGIIEEINQNNESSLRTFQFEDHTLRKKTYGLYQYGIEIKFEDGTLSFLQDKLTSLSSAIRGLTNYYTIATSIKFYDAHTRRFNKSLANFYELNGGEAPWEDAIEAYIGALSKIIYSGFEQDIMSSTQISNLALELNNLANPNLGTPEGISALITLLQNLEDLIIKTLQGKTRFISQQLGGSQSEIYHKDNYNRFILDYSHNFREYVDSDFPDGTGIHVLPTESPTLYLNKFKTRAQEESLKYFKYKSPGDLQKNIGKVPGVDSENSGITNVSDSFYTFFSPSKITVSGQSLDLQNKGNATWDNSNYERFTTFLLQSGGGPKLQSPVYSVNKTGNKKVSSKDSNKTQTPQTIQLLENMLSGYSVTISETMEENKTTKETIASSPPGSSMSAKSTPRKEGPIHSDLLSSAVMDTSRIFTSLAITNSLNRNKNKQPTIKPTIRSYDLTTSDNLIDNSVRKSPIKKGQLENIPNQISSLFLSQSPAVKNNWQNYEKQGIDFISNNQTDLMFLYNYSTLFKVEYRDGYEKGKDGQDLLNQPIWKELTEKAIKRIEKSEILLCRIEKYENLEIGVQFPELLELPIFDQHFFLAKNKSTLEKAKKSPKPKKSKLSNKKLLREANAPGNFEVSAFSKGIIRSGK
jgi:hypothetical protein